MKFNHPAEIFGKVHIEWVNLITHSLIVLTWQDFWLVKLVKSIIEKFRIHKKIVMAEGCKSKSVKLDYKIASST